MRYREITKNGYTGYLLAPESRSNLLGLFPPKYPDVFAHHITLKFPATNLEPIPDVATANVIGYADDGAGLEALVVELDRTTRRAGGGNFHITWSLDKAKGRKPVQSNALIQKGFDPISPIRIEVIPTFFQNK